MRKFHLPSTLSQLVSILKTAQSKANSVYFSTASGVVYVLQIGENDKIYYAYVGTNENVEISWDRFQKLKTEIWEDVKE